MSGDDAEVKPRDLLDRAARGNVSNVRFADLQRLVLALGFHLVRSQGSHHIYSQKDVLELVDLQDRNGQAKPYQVRQVVELAERYSLRVETKE